MDENQSRYSSKLASGTMEDLGIQVITTRLVSKSSDPYYDPKLLVAALLSLT